MGKKLEIFLLILGGFLSGFVGSLGVGGGGVLPILGSSSTYSTPVK